MASAGSIYVDLLLRDSKYVEGWNRARGVTKSSTSAMQGQLAKTGQAFSVILNPISSVTNAVKNLGLAVGGAISVEKLIKYSDTWKQLTGRLSIVSSGSGEVAARQEQLYKIAQETRQPLSDIVDFYTRLNQFIPQTERAQYDLLGVTQSVSSALAITGESAISAQNALIQFTQGIGTNFEAAGQELRSLQELAPRLTQALQKALGNGTDSLQQLVKAGKLTRESVLTALSGMGEEGKKLKEELAKIPVTVGQSFTILNNAVLKYIGSSGAVSSATATLASAVRSLADNIDLVVKAFTLFGAVLSGAYIGKLAASAVAALSATSAHIAFARAATVATGQIGVMTTAVAGLRLALASMYAMLGGPVGIAAIGIFAVWALNADKAKETQEKYNAILAKTSSEMSNFKNISKAAQDEAIKNADRSIQAAALEVEALGKAIEAYYKLGAAKRFVYNIKSALGIEDTIGEMNKSFEIAQKAANEIRKIKATAFEDVRIAKPDRKLTEHQQSLLDKYAKELGGVSETTKKYNIAQRELGELAKSNLITKEQEASALANFAERMGVWYTDMEEIGKSTAMALRDSFSEFLFDPFESGLSGMVESFAKTVRKMVADLVASNLLTYLARLTGFADAGGVVTGESVGKGMSSAGSGIASFFSSIFDGMFASGGYIQPGHFGIAGEDGAELIYGGNTGASVIPQGASGGGTVVNIINNSGSKVSAKSSKSGNKTNLQIMIDEAVADNMTKSGSKTQQALGTYSRRTLVRR